MSSETVVLTEGLSKSYRIGGPRDRYPTLRGALSRSVTGLARSVGRLARNASEPDSADPLRVFWALRDVGLEVRQGDVIGLIGKNGAGKTTLMRILSRITDPTEGWAEVRGRVGSLLEVGTGFHPELTGRENVQLNGAILGMRTAEIRRRFDEIVAFAEIDEFLDTPVKFYSSGMYVRLAFAIAAHVEPELLMVDEVLAVGDAAFQKKCLGKMGEIAGEGRTVIFVSHNMAVVQALCKRCLYLEGGRIIDDGPTDSVMSTYLRSLEQSAAVDLSRREDRSSRLWLETRLARIDITGVGGESLATGRPARFVFHLEGEEMGRLVLAFAVHDELGLPVARFDSSAASPGDSPDGDPMKVVCEVDELPFLPGRYRIDVSVWGNGHIQDELDAAASFDVEPGLMRGRPAPNAEGGAKVTAPHRWTLPR